MLKPYIKVTLRSENKMKHQHSQVIKAFADGKDCEYFFSNEVTQGWFPIADIRDFYYQEAVRIKPLELKKEIRFTIAHLESVYEPKTFQHEMDNLKLTFDGESKKLIFAEVIK